MKWGNIDTRPRGGCRGPPLRYVAVFSRRVDRLADLAGVVAGWMLLACMVVSGGNALTRKLFGVSSNAWLELQWHLFVAAVMLGAGYALKTGGHIRVDDLRQRFQQRHRDTVDLLFLVVIMAPAVVVVLLTSLPFLLRSLGLDVGVAHGVSIARFAGSEMSRNPGGLVVWPAKAWIVVGFGLVLLQGASEVGKLVLRRSPAPPSEPG